MRHTKQMLTSLLKENETFVNWLAGKGFKRSCCINAGLSLLKTLPDREMFAALLCTMSSQREEYAKPGRKVGLNKKVVK